MLHNAADEQSIYQRTGVAGMMSCFAAGGPRLSVQVLISISPSSVRARDCSARRMARMERGLGSPTLSASSGVYGCGVLIAYVLIDGICI